MDGKKVAKLFQLSKLQCTSLVAMKKEDEASLFIRTIMTDIKLRN